METSCGSKLLICMFELVSVLIRTLIIRTIGDHIDLLLASGNSMTQCYCSPQKPRRRT